MGRSTVPCQSAASARVEPNTPATASQLACMRRVRGRGTAARLPHRCPAAIGSCTVLASLASLSISSAPPAQLPLPSLLHLSPVRFLRVSAPVLQQLALGLLHNNVFNIHPFIYHQPRTPRKPPLDHRWTVCFAFASPFRPASS